jgi:hypothetical protein
MRCTLAARVPWLDRLLSGSRIADVCVGERGRQGQILRSRALQKYRKSLLISTGIVPIKFSLFAAAITQKEMRAPMRWLIFLIFNQMRYVLMMRAQISEKRRW